MTKVDRRDFIKLATAGAGLAVTGVSESQAATVSAKPPLVRHRQGGDVIVIGAGSFGMWTALNLRRAGASVRVVDPFGPANSRSTSGGETRGVRSSYGDRPHGFLWTRWAGEARERWAAWDQANAERLLPRVFFTTGDLILRDEMSPYLEDTHAYWDQLGTPYEVLTPEEIRRRWPWIRLDGINIGSYEPNAGVVRARRAIESVAQVFQDEGGTIEVGRAALGQQAGGRLQNIALEPSGEISGSTFVFACGPWLPKVFPDVMGRRLRIPIGHTFYFAVPPGDTRFMYPNMPSYGVPGCTGWPALGPDHRGFRVRTGGRPPEDPDVSDRWIDREFHERPREILRTYFPDLAETPISETRACHYESSVDRNFIVDKHPGFENVWIAGGGSAESFKFGPMLGEYIANRVLGIADDPELAENFRLKEEEFEQEEDENRNWPD